MIDYVDKNVQRLLHMIEAIKRLSRMLVGVSVALPELKDKIIDAVKTIPLPNDFVLPVI